MKETKNLAHFSVKDITMCALFAAVICVLAPWSIPIGPVPITLGVFAVVLTGLMLPVKCSVISVLIYILLGCVGLPVFSKGQAGFGVLAGATGGYIWSYPLMALLISVLVYFTEKKKHKEIITIILYTAFCALAVLVCYTCGTIHFTLYKHVTFKQALEWCVIPFVIPDLVKCVAASVFATRMKKILHY